MRSILRANRPPAAGGDTRGFMKWAQKGYFFLPMGTVIPLWCKRMSPACWTKARLAPAALYLAALQRPGTAKRVFFVGTGPSKRLPGESRLRSQRVLHCLVGAGSATMHRPPLGRGRCTRLAGRQFPQGASQPAEVTNHDVIHLVPVPPPAPPVPPPGLFPAGLEVHLPVLQGGCPRLPGRGRLVIDSSSLRGERRSGRQ